MTELIVFPVSLVVLFAAWHFLWLPAAAGFARDHLFDLRDEALREHFLDSEMGLADPAYLVLRRQIDSSIRYLGATGLISFMSFVKHMEKNQELIEECRARWKASEAAFPSEHRIMWRKVQRQSADITLRYMVMSSIIGVASLFVVMVKELFTDARKALNFRRNWHAAESQALILSSGKKLRDPRQAREMVRDAVAAC